MDSCDVLLKEINSIREKLLIMSNLGIALTDSQFVKKSQELDVLIFKYQKLLLLKRLIGKSLV